MQHLKKKSRWTVGDFPPEQRAEKQYELLKQAWRDYLHALDMVSRLQAGMHDAYMRKEELGYQFVFELRDQVRDWGGEVSRKYRQLIQMGAPRKALRSQKYFKRWVRQHWLPTHGMKYSDYPLSEGQARRWGKKGAK